jgi:hypothetical protein
MPNAYYNPEKLGLTIVGELEYSDMNWCFDTRLVWKDEKGTLYTARDSGCSCPSPFEDYNSLESLEKVSYAALERTVKAEESWGNPSFDTDRRDFLRKVKTSRRG